MSKSVKSNDTKRKLDKILNDKKEDINLLSENIINVNKKIKYENELTAMNKNTNLKNKNEINNETIELTFDDCSDYGSVDEVNINLEIQKIPIENINHAEQIINTEGSF